MADMDARKSKQIGCAPSPVLGTKSFTATILILRPAILDSSDAPDQDLEFRENPLDLFTREPAALRQPRYLAV